MTSISKIVKQFKKRVQDNFSKFQNEILRFRKTTNKQTSPNTDSKGHKPMNNLATEKGRSTLKFSNPEAINRMNQKGIRHIVGKGSNRGRQRAVNEDCIASFEYTQLLKSISYPIGAYILSDGMGGHANGDVASNLAVTTIAQQLIQALFMNNDNGTFKTIPQESFRSMLENAAFTANDKIYQQAQSNGNEMGATLNAAIISGRTAYIINIGDSRTYLYNVENGLQLITQDHSLVFRLYLMGDLKNEEIYNHPQRNHILRSLGEAGLHESLQEMMEQSNHPYFYQVTLEQGDSLLFCSDGLWQEARDKKIEKILRTHRNPQEACDELIDHANRCGGNDNISLILVKIE